MSFSGDLYQRKRNKCIPDNKHLQRKDNKRAQLSAVLIKNMPLSADFIQFNTVCSDKNMPVKCCFYPVKCCLF